MVFSLSQAIRPERVADHGMRGMLRGRPRGVNENRLRTGGLTPCAAATSAPDRYFSHPAGLAGDVPLHSHSDPIVEKAQPPDEFRKSLPAEVEIRRGPAALAQ